MGTYGMADASTTRSRSIPWTVMLAGSRTASGPVPILHVQDGCSAVSPSLATQSRICSAVSRSVPLLPRAKSGSPQVVFRLSTKLPISSPMTVTRYSCPVSISITARAWPAGVAAEKSPKPVVVITVKLK